MLRSTPRRLLTYLTFSIVFLANAQDQQVRNYTTGRVQGKIPTIDGRGVDPAWRQVDWTGDFIQRQPVDGAAPSQQTQFKILYDLKYLYVLVRAFDDQPDEIVKRMSRRDGFEGDRIEINIDSYHDKRTAFSFTASASGVKGEEYVSNNGDDWDDTWDPIWFLKTSVDSLGWVAEFKIPLSQLRFANVTEHTWGLQVMRYIFREEERSYWQPIAQDSPGWVHLFGELTGIRGIKPQKQLEIQPYILAKNERSPSEGGSPFQDGSYQDLDVGLDAKIGITSDITLDLTINPDFGQVEADPSTVNLSAFQLFFRERRPFFLEGNNILDFRLTDSNAGGFFNNDNLFYSRRIGGSPSYFPDDDDIAYTDRTRNTRILGAAKLTGKNRNGLSWGVLESYSREQYLLVEDTLGAQREIAVEPATNYLVGRIQQDINQGNALLGAMVTSTNRFINEPHLDFLHSNAYSAGVDFTQFFSDRNFYVTANSQFSSVDGSEESILETQTSSERFYQRPDNYHAEVDSTRTSLQGSGGTISLGKRNGSIIFQTGATMRTPGFELNDIGFLVRSDYISQWTWAQHRILKPFGAFRWTRVNFNQYLNWDFDGVNTFRAININGHAQFKNFWNLGFGHNLRGEQVSNADLRGGPSIRYPRGGNFWFYASTNDQKKFSFELNPYVFWGENDWSRGWGIWTFLNWQPINALRVTLEPNLSIDKNALQYVETIDDDGFNEYILANIDQVTISAPLRINYIFTPNLSLEYWGQPFISRGEYSDFKKVLQPNAEQFEKRYGSFDTRTISYLGDDEVYRLDLNDDGQFDYDLDDPNFNFMQFRSNMVLRWEYIPGSTLFLVWTTNATDSHNSRRNAISDLTGDLRNVSATNIFLVKYTYRFVL